MDASSLLQAVARFYLHLLNYFCMPAVIPRTRRVLSITDNDHHNIIESILSRLPVKSLLRFKSVCKQWSATISDPKFAETHLQASNTSSSSYLTPWTGIGLFKRIRLENDEFHREPSATMENQLVAVGYLGSKVLCYYDGVFLLSRHGTNSKDYVVWNPSSRTYREVRWPYQCDPFILFTGICYDPLMKDYKVVIGDDKIYAVYYCKTESWSGLKETNGVHPDPYPHGVHHNGVHLNGSIYWISESLEIVCFDGRDEELKISSPESPDCLCFFPMRENYRSDYLLKEMVVMKKVGEEPWMKHEQKLPFPCLYVKPLCSSAQENKTILVAHDHDNQKRYLLYDDTEKCVTEIQNPEGFNCSRLFPILENLVLL